METPKPIESNPLDSIELKRTKVDRTVSAASQPDEGIQKRSPTIILGSQSVTLKNRCVIYRNVVSKRQVVTIIPFWSVDSFAIRAFKPRWSLSLGIFFFLVSVLAGLLTYASALGREIIGGLFGSWVPESRLVWIPFLFLFVGIIALLVYASRSQTELVVYSRSADNNIRFPLSDKTKDSVEQFVTEIEAQMGRV